MTSASVPSLTAPPLWRRMTCWLYEGILIFAVLFIGSYLFSTLTQTRHGLANRHAQQFFLFLLLGVYFTWFWARGQTLAMKTWHVRLVDTHGNRLTQGRAALRYLFSWAWFVPPFALGSVLGWAPTPSIAFAALWILIWALLSKVHSRGQFVHDVLAGTFLIDARPR